MKLSEGMSGDGSYGRSGDITLWILTDSGLLRRISTNRVTGGLTVDLTSHEPVKIDLPPLAHR